MEDFFQILWPPQNIRTLTGSSVEWNSKKAFIPIHILRKHLYSTKLNLTSYFFKVWTFWEEHKIWKNLPLKIWHYWVTSNLKWKIFSNFVSFSECPNFTYKFSRSVLFQINTLSFQSFTDWILQNCLVKLQITRLFK